VQCSVSVMKNNTIHNSSFFFFCLKFSQPWTLSIFGMICCDMCSSTLKAHLFLHNLVWDLVLNPQASVVFRLSRYSSPTLFIPRLVNSQFSVLLKMQVSFALLYILDYVLLYNFSSLDHFLPFSHLKKGLVRSCIIV
jgi:hypothetical protein